VQSCYRLGQQEAYVAFSIATYGLVGCADMCFLLMILRASGSAVGIEASYWLGEPR
jgi:hypothetical protein